MVRREFPQGRTVVVTGGGGGLGRAMVVELRRRGARVLAVDVDADRLDRLQRETGCDILLADLTDAAGRAAIIDRCTGGRTVAHTLVNNAGVEKAGRFGDLDAAEICRVLDVNLVGTMLLTHALLPHLRATRAGHVITMASMAGIKPVPYNAAYNTSKAGLVAFSLSLSKDLRGTGVDATVICPSAVSGAGMWARASGRLPRNRLVESSTVTPEAVVAAVLRAMAERPRRILVGSPLVRVGALLSALSPALDRATDSISHIESVYSARVGTDRGNRL